MLSRISIVIMFPLVLIGCATPYVQPVGPDTATLTFQNLAPLSIGVQGFKVGEDCSGGKVNFNQTTRLQAGEQLEIRAPANKAFSFYYNYVFGSKYCLMPATFTPKQGESYKARFATSGDKCFLSITTVSDKGETKEPSFRLRKWRTPFSESGSFCS